MNLKNYSCLRFKVVFLLWFAVSISKPMLPQGLLNDGARIVFSGTAQLYIAGGSNGNYTSQNGGLITPASGSQILLEGDWNNNSNNTGFNADAGTVNMNGAAQNIQGTNGTTFYNLTLTGAGTKTLNHATNVNTSVGGVTTTTGVLSLGTQVLDLNTRKLIITNPTGGLPPGPTGAVTWTTGYIQSEHQAPTNGSIVQWNVGTSTGGYFVPFGKAATRIPLTINILSAMSAASDNFQVSTRSTATSDNTPFSTGVTSISDPSLPTPTFPATIATEAVIDRWWDFRWSDNASAGITFSYIGSPENSMIPAYTAVTAKYWNGTTWAPPLGLGSAPAQTIGVGTVTIGNNPSMSFAANTYTPMLLFAMPPLLLPLELSKWETSCEQNTSQLNWTTASENNIAFFTIQKSEDGIQFTNAANINSQGNSSQFQSYSWTDNSTSSSYYRLMQTEINGTEKMIGQSIYSNCGGNFTESEIVLFPNPTSGSGNLQLTSATGGEIILTVYDAKGALVKNEIISVQKGKNNLNFYLEAAPGIYQISVSINGEIKNTRMIVE